MALVDIDNLKEIIREDSINNIIKILEYTKCHQIWNSSDEVRCATPQGYNKTELAVNTETLYCRIYLPQEVWKGDIFSLIQHLMNVNFIESVEIVLTCLGINKGSLKRKKKIDTDNPLNIFKKIRNASITRSLDDIEIKEYELEYLNSFIIMPHIELLKEAILPDTMKLFKTGFDPRTNRIIFPHFQYDSTDKIVGVTGRTLATDDEIKLLNIPKYWNYIKGYKKMANIYGFSHSVPNITDMLIIHEGEKSVLKHFSQTRNKGFSVSIGGHEISDYQIDIIKRYTPLDCEIVISFDKDVMIHSGKTFFQEICKKIGRYRRCSYIWDKDNILDEKDAPIDKGVKKFNYLLESRIKS